MAEEAELWNNEEYTKSYNDFNEANREYYDARTEWLNDPTPKNKQDMENAENIKNTKRLDTFKTLSDKVLEIDGSFFDVMDFSNSWESSKQPKMTEGQKANMESFKNKITEKANDIQSQLKLKEFLSGVGDEVKLMVQPDGSIKWNESFEAKTKNFYEDNVKDKMSYENFKSLLKLAMVGLAIFGIVELALLFKKFICGFAKAKSGCYWYSNDGSTIEQVNFNSHAPVSPNCSSYDTCCGGCDKGTLQSICDGSGQNQKCCNSAIDTNADKHKDGRYMYKCESIEDVFANFFKDLGSALSPSNLMKYVMIFIYIIAGIIGAYILYALVRYFIERGEE